jgi:hypothetical protein
MEALIIITIRLREAAIIETGSGIAKLTLKEG